MRQHIGIPLIIFLLGFFWLPMSAHAVDYAALYKELSPSVVTIRTASVRDVARGNFKGSGVGSGFLVKDDLVMTAAHVVDGAHVIHISFKDGKRFQAEVISSIASSDVALLRMNKPHPEPVLVELGSDLDVAVGEPVFVIGAPFGIEYTLSIGHLSGKSTRSLMAGGAPVRLLQTDTAINPGNSGGPMFNQKGEVIGVVSFILTKSGGFNGVGFATSMETAHDALMNSSGFWAGFEGVLLTEDQARALNLPEVGILVQRVVSGSAAAASGLKAGTIPAKVGNQDLLLGGDVIMEINGLVCAEPHDFRELSEAARDTREDHGYAMRVMRRGQEKMLVAIAEAEFKPYVPSGAN